jgi:hypothetical protein
MRLRLTSKLAPRARALNPTVLRYLARACAVPEPSSPPAPGHREGMTRAAAFAMLMKDAP